MSNLADRLDRLRESFAKKAPPEAREVMQRHTRELRESGVMERVHRAGAPLPPFALRDTDGNTVRSEDLLRDGSLVISWYRGVW